MAQHPGDSVMALHENRIAGDHEELSGPDPAEVHECVGCRGLRASMPITCRTRCRARASRTDLQRTAWVNPADAAAAGPDVGDVQARYADRQAVHGFLR